MRASIDELIERGDVAHHGEHREVLETFRMFAHDQGWLRRMREAVLSGLTAEAAVERVQSDNRARMLRQTDPYLRDRLHDLDDLANRLLHRLVGRDLVAERGSLPDNAIIVARSMGPAALLDYDRSRLRGLVLEEGGPTSHIAIVARALGIPAVGRGRQRHLARRAGRRDHRRRRRAATSRSGRARTSRPPTRRRRACAPAARSSIGGCATCLPSPNDGVEVTLQLNAGLLVDLPHLGETGASGVGLFRTELQFMVAERMPIDERAAGALQGGLRRGGRHAGHLPDARHRRRQGPALHAVDRGGEPGSRLARHPHRPRPAGTVAGAGLAPFSRRPAGGPCGSCFRWLRPATSFRARKRPSNARLNHLARHGYALPSELKLGVMLEVPSLLFQIDEICRAADFVSVGSNDLMQFLFAVDRENRMVARPVRSLERALASGPKLVAESAARLKCTATICGEIGGRPLEAMALIGIGYRSLSMAPTSIGPVKAMLLTLDAAKVGALSSEELARSGDGTSLRPVLTDFAETHGIPI